MTIPIWPATLPQQLEVNAYSESVPNLTIASQMDAGPAKVRRRLTAGVRPVHGQITLTTAELRSLVAFYKDDLSGGALRFLWKDPIEPETDVEMRFVDPPSWVCTDGLYCVSVSLEIMP